MFNEILRHKQTDGRTAKFEYSNLIFDQPAVQSFEMVCYRIFTRFSKKSSRVGFYFMNNVNDLYINNSNKLQIQYNTKTTAF